MAEQTDFERLLARVLAGDRQAGEHLYRAYNPMLSRYMRSQEPRVADDLTAEVWLAAINALTSFEGDEPGFRAWMFTIARRRVVEHRRRGIRRRTDTTDPDDFLETGSDEDIAVTATNSTEAQEAIDLIAATLSPEQAEVLILRVVADLSAAQVGDLLGRPEAWVRITQHRAIKKLAARLDARMQVTQ